MSLKFEFSREELNDIIERYNNWESMCSISEDYPCSYQVIKRTLKEQGVFDEFRKIRRYFVDESAFSGELDEEKSYWLGFLIADGCLKEYTKTDKRVIIKLQKKDYKHLSKFYKFVKSNKKVYFDSGSTCCTASISSCIMFDDIVSYGITPNKTYTTKVPKKIIGSKYEKDFWRGVIDGDGSVWEGKSSPGISLVGTKEICDGFLNFINREGFRTSMRTKKRKNDKSYNMTFSSRDTVNLLEILYKNSTIYLDRKFKRANSLIEKYKNKIYIKRQKKTMNGDRKVIKVENKFVLFSDYLEKLGIIKYYNIVYNRFYIYGWSLEKAVTTPFKRKEVL